MSRTLNISTINLIKKVSSKFIKKIQLRYKNIRLLISAISKIVLKIIFLCSIKFYGEIFIILLNYRDKYET